MKKRIFITSKIYHTGELSISDIESSVQKDLDILTGCRVKFNINLISDKEVELIFHRGFEYDSYYKNSILDLDGEIITGKGLISLPFDWYNNPFNYICYIDIDEFQSCYKRSAVKLGANRPKDIQTEIYSDKVVLRLSY